MLIIKNVISIFNCAASIVLLSLVSSPAYSQSSGVLPALYDQIDPTTNKITLKEIDAFNQELNSVSNYKQATNYTPTSDNWAFGYSGNAIETAGMMFELSHNVDLLKQMSSWADAAISQRNDNAEHRKLWTGNINDPVWPNQDPCLNKPSSMQSATCSSYTDAACKVASCKKVYPTSTSTQLECIAAKVVSAAVQSNQETCIKKAIAGVPYTGAENGDIVGHIAYTAKLILQTPAIWNQKAPKIPGVLDGETYLNRAKHYVTQARLTAINFLIPYLIDNKDNFRQRFPLNKALADTQLVGIGQTIPWNQQTMINNAFLRLAECYNELATNPLLLPSDSPAIPKLQSQVKQYTGYVAASVKNFFANTHKLESTEGDFYYLWDYSADVKPFLGKEDTAHGRNDILNLYRIYSSPLFKGLISKDQMANIAQGMVDIIFNPATVFDSNQCPRWSKNPKECATWAGRVDGTSDSRSEMQFVPRPEYFYYLQFLPNEDSQRLKTCKSFVDSLTLQHLLGRTKFDAYVPLLWLKQNALDCFQAGTN